MGEDGVNEAQRGSHSIDHTVLISVFGTWSGRGRPAVHAATMTRVPAVRWSPARFTVTVLITVTHLEHSSTTHHTPLTQKHTTHNSGANVQTGVRVTDRCEGHRQV